MTSTTAQHSPFGEALAAASSRFRAAIASFVGAHRQTISWLSPVMVLSAIATFINMGGSPQRIDDEGTYTAQAYAITHFGEISHYTYWYDHPPLGWLQIGAYDQLTGAFARYGVSVLAGREAVIVASVISVALLWSLARRIGLSRPAAAAAGLIFALSPLAVQFHRTVYLDNVAVPWLIAAFLLALSKRNQLAGFAGSALCFSIAVLSKETFLLALPFLAWVMIRSSRKATRRYTLSVASSVLVLVGASYILLALVKGELLPGKGRVSLTDGVLFQLATRAGSGSLFDPESLISKTTSVWWTLDPVIIVLGILAAASALLLSRLRPFAVMTLFLVAFMFRPGGYLPVPYVIILLPFAALLIAGVSESALRGIRSRIPGIVRVRSIAWVAIAALAVVAAAPLWTVQLRGLFLADLDSPLRSAESWVETNVPRDNRVIVDDAMWVDFVRSGFSRSNVVWYYKVDTDPAVEAQSPQGWKDSDYIVTTDSMRTFPDAFPQVQNAITNSVVVASFGSGTQAVDIRKIEPQGAAAAKTEMANAKADRIAAGTALVANDGLTVNTANRNLLTGGRVDARIPLALGSELASTDVAVADFPAIAGEAGQPLRKVLISSIAGSAAIRDGQLSPAAREFVASLTGDFTPSATSINGSNLSITWSVSTATSVVAG